MSLRFRFRATGFGLNCYVLDNEKLIGSVKINHNEDNDTDEDKE